MPQLAAAHLVTVHASDYGDPEITVMTRDEGQGASPIESLAIGTGGVETAVEILRDAGWAVTGTWTKVDRGYLVADVER